MLREIRRWSRHNPEHSVPLLIGVLLAAAGIVIAAAVATINA